MNPAPIAHTRLAVGLAILVALATGCADDGPTLLLPANYESSYTTVRDCRRSGDHDFNRMRVLTDPAATDPYLLRMSEFPVGSVVVKEEFDPSDDTCSGDILVWTVMSRLPTGSSPETLDWAWQRVTHDQIVSDDDRGCINCHASCGVPPDGFAGTCTVP